MGQRRIELLNLPPYKLNVEKFYDSSKPLGH